MRKKILISVVVPAFNEEKLIGRCLVALKEQDFSKENYEIIVVDNNSWDKTAEIAKKMEVKVVREEKKGYVFALRKGCSEAKGEIIATTDADSQPPKGWLKTIFKAFEKDSQVVCVGGGTIHKNKNFMAVLIEIIYNVIGPVFKTFPGYNLAFKKSAYDKIGGFREEVNMCGDTELCLRLQKRGKMVFLKDNKVVTSSRRFTNPGSTSYTLKGMINIICLVLFKKTLFFEFGDIRD